MTPPRKKLAHNEVHQFDDEVSKRMRLVSADELYSPAHPRQQSRPFAAEAQRTTVSFNHLQPSILHPSLNSAFQPLTVHHHQQAHHQQHYQQPHWTRTHHQHHTTPSYPIEYRQQPEMYFFKNENSADFSNKRCRSFFKNYASDTDPEVIGPEGIEKLCGDLQVKPEDIVILVLSWKLKAKIMGIYTLSEWIEGMSDLKCDSVVKLRNKIAYLRSCLSDPSLFRSIYRYSFDFAKESDQRCMDIDIAKQMISLLLASRWRLAGVFTEYLSQCKFKSINKDQFFNILDFSRSVNDDLLNYDENSAWPVMMDEFVEWARKCRGFHTPVVEVSQSSDEAE